MKSEFGELAQYRMERAKNTIKDARVFFNEASSASIVNRIYYAMFYAVNALLITEGKFSSKHSGVRALFNRDFVKQGIVSLENGKFYSEMFDARQEGDYKDFIEFDNADISVWIEKAERFINSIDLLVRERL